MSGVTRLFVGMALAFALAACATENVRTNEQAELAAPEDQVVLEVRGAISRTNGNGAARFDRTMLEAMPSIQLQTSTSVTDGVHLFEGVLVRDVLERLGAKGVTVTAAAHNDYVVDIPFSDFERFDAILAYRMDREPLSPTDKGPLWIVYPRDQKSELQDIRYDYRWVWQLKTLEIK